MNNTNKLQLRKILSNHFVKFSLIPILIVEITLLILYFSINKYISIQNTDFLLNQAQTNTKELLKKESSIVNDKLSEISQLATLLQREHELIFSNSNRFSLPNEEPQFAFADNKVFYKTNKVGSSLYYSAKTQITQVERNKAIFTEAMDVSLKNIVDVNHLAVAAYFNSWDNMNRLYPFIDDVSTQYGEHIQMEDYNFYYLADKKHNPEKKAVWTGAYLDPAGLGWMLSCIVPIYNNEFLEGVTGIDITIDSFVKNILNQEFLYDAKLFIVDNDGMIIAMPEKIEALLGLKELKEHLYTDAILKTIEKPEDYNITKSNYIYSEKFKNLIKNNVSSETLNINNKDYLALSQNVDETNWKLMIVIDKSNILKSIQDLENLSNKIGYLAIGFLLLFYIVFFYSLLKKINFFSEKITEPLVDLSNQTTLIIKKDTEFKEVNTNIEEISQLNDNFMHMLNVLNERNKKLNDAKIYAENANKSKDEFLANMSHELKTPLNSINIISNIMIKNKSNNFNEKELENIGIINKCGENLIYLVNDMLALSKIDTNNIDLKNKTINIKDMINRIYKKFEEQAKEKGLLPKLIMDEKLDLMHSDEIKINQIIKSLLSNALKFSHKGTISLIIKDSEDEIKILVEDEGVGIEEKKFQYIFDRFTQIDGTTTRKYGGVGLGLSICKELVLLLNGKISVKSKINEGSSFEVILPKNKDLVNIEEIDNIKQDIQLEENHETFNSKFKINSDGIIKEEKNKILVLNNDHLLFFSIIIQLKKKYEVKQASNLEELLKLKNENEYEKIIIDISKFNNDEKEMLLSNTSDSFFIIYENENENDKEFSKSNCKFFQKPITKDLLINIIN
jgi:signal transduction histidine kinase